MQLLLTGALALLATAQAEPPAVVPFGETGELRICSESIVRVTHRPTSAAVEKTSLIAKSDWPHVDFSVQKHEDTVEVRTSKLLVQASITTGHVSFSELSGGRPLLKETSAKFLPVTDLGKDTYQVEQSWEGDADEGLYGGGNYQNGLVNYKYAPIQMIHFNTEAVVPFFLSTAGYGLLWDNYAWSYLNPPEKAALVAPNANANGSVTFTPEVSGDHFIMVGHGFPPVGTTPQWNTAGRAANVSLIHPDGNETIVLQWGAANTPKAITSRVPNLIRGQQYTIHYSWDLKGAGLYVQGPEYGRTTLRSVLGDLIDYYFVAGGNPDAVVAGYRELTGTAPLQGRWAFGFWQCKEHYDTQAHLMSAAHEFRNRSLPVDAIVQDWHYWGKLGWGPQWDHSIYPDPAGMVKELRDLHMRFMVSVWSKFDLQTTFYKQMSDKKWLMGKSNYYDAWNPEARELFYNFSRAAHFSIGVDSLWLDASEPEGYTNVNVNTFLGSGNAYQSTYSLKTTQAISDGLRRDYPQSQGARVFSLTRSSFAGQQRNGAAYWTGDTTSSWDVLRRQIAGSINFQLSGMPYWSEDVGGFFRPQDQYTSSDYHELLIRWFQFGALTPIFRVHGSGTNTELWNFGDATMRIINASAISLRYRLLPYTYSGFARVEFEGYTMQRGLVMDFPQDMKVRNIADEFMWGDALLVTPLHTPRQRESPAAERQAYLPEAASWVDFHTGSVQPSGDVRLSFGLDKTPLFARAGSLLVLGPLRQHTEDGPTDPLELRVYPGKDATFTLFEDDGTSRGYQTGASSTITFTWDDAQSTLFVGERKGSYPGMLQVRQLHIVRVRPGRGVGVEPATPDTIVKYEGKATSVKLDGQDDTRMVVV